MVRDIAMKLAESKYWHQKLSLPPGPAIFWLRALGKLLNITELQFSHLEDGDHNGSCTTCIRFFFFEEHSMR